MTAKQKNPKTPDNGDLDLSSMAAIRDLLAAEEPVKAKPAPKRLAKKVAAAQAQPEAVEPKASRPVERTAQEPAAQAQPEPEPKRLTRAERKAAKQAEKIEAAEAKAALQAEKAQAAAAKAQQVAQEGGLIDRLKAKITGYRPTVKHILIAAAVLLVLFRPWLVIGVLVLSAFLVTAIFLIVGYDGFWRHVMGLARWYAQRHPSRSKEIHRKLDDFAMKFDAFLDRFPEGSVDGLYLPDFGDLAEADARHDEALDRRFDTLRESEA